MNTSTRAQLESEMHQALSEAQSALEQPANGANTSAANELRASALAKVKAARATLAATRDRAVESSKAAARATDAYAHDHPWRLVGAAVAVGMVVGLLLRRGR
jgi:ElaB/YqjD/DUF883 family membrane-anchored ribosome-binding protein